MRYLDEAKRSRDMGEENGDSIENIIYRHFLNRISAVVRCKFFIFFYIFSCRRFVIINREQNFSVLDFGQRGEG